MPQKYEREIEDILRRVDGPARGRATDRRTRGQSRALLDEWFGSIVRVLTPNHLMVAAIVLAALGYLSGRVLPGFALWLSLLSLLTFVGSIALSVTRNRRHSEPIWRGQVVRFRRRQPMFWTDLTRKWREWRRGSRWH